MMKRIPAAEICSSFLILLYAYTAASKLLRFNRFRFVLSESPLIHNGAGVIAWLLPTAEILIVLLLIIPQFRMAGLKISLGTLLLFTGYLIYIIVFANHLPCSCGGVISSLSWKQHIFFNLFFIAINIMGMKSARLFNHKAVT
jgi:hypothetical protein